ETNLGVTKKAESYTKSITIIINNTIDFILNYLLIYNPLCAKDFEDRQSLATFNISLSVALFPVNTIPRNSAFL
ncbi:MAG TPA: hypothetical protein VLY03_09945, partial [Bacteroidota bacterium]|nr:hypothetical protein [Bacteroidota bacterium]